MSQENEEDARWLAWVRDHPELAAVLRELSLGDGEASRIVGFVVHYRELLRELEVDNLADSAARRLRFLRSHEELLDHLEGLGSKESDQALKWLRFCAHHPQTVEYLRRRATLAVDIEHAVSPPYALRAMPRVELIWRLVRRRVLGLRT